MGLIVLLRQTEAQLSGKSRKEIPGHFMSLNGGLERHGASPLLHHEPCSTSFAKWDFSNEGGDVRRSACILPKPSGRKRQCLCEALLEVPATALCTPIHALNLGAGHDCQVSLPHINELQEKRVSAGGGRGPNTSRLQCNR